MAIKIELFKEALAGLEEAVVSEVSALFDGEIENLVTLIAEAIAFGESATLAEVRPVFERLYSRSKIQAKAARIENERLGQLRALTMLAVVGARTTRPQEPQKIVTANEKIVRALIEANEPLDNQAIAKRSGYSEATVARMMPELRAAGIVESVRDWRRQVNRLTPSGRAMAEELSARRVEESVERRAFSRSVKRGRINVKKRFGSKNMTIVRAELVAPSKIAAPRHSVHPDKGELEKRFPETVFSEGQKKRAEYFMPNMAASMAAA